jgi:catechol 2,3-dioxygenase-like lactoylglutathione lyase family enzyme
MFTITQTNVTIMVKDLSKAIRFYEDVLGFRLMKRYGEFYAQISAPGIVIGLHPSDGKPNSSENISIGFTDDDFSQVKTRLEELKIQHQERSEEGGNFIHFKDPDGTPLYFIKPRQ